MGMKGAFLFGEEWSRHFHFCSAQKEEIGSSFAHKQLNSVRVPLRRATGKNTTVFAVSCAMQCMSCFELVSLMGMNRTSGVGRHTGVIPEAPACSRGESSHLRSQPPPISKTSHNKPIHIEQKKPAS
jgi:hypothetical protein